jgi:hypothetical protein
MSDVNAVWAQVGIILSDGINKYLLSFYMFLWPQFRNLIVTLCISHFCTQMAPLAYTKYFFFKQMIYDVFTHLLGSSMLSWTAVLAVLL